MGTLASGLEARGIRSADNLTAAVEGEIEDIDGVLRITRIRLHYSLQIPAGTRQRVQRLLETYADHCPAYQSVKGCIDCTWEAQLKEEA